MLQITGVGAIALVALAVAGCGGDDGDEAAETQTAPTTRATTTVQRPPLEGEAPTTRSLTGLWSRQGDRLLWRFDADGTWAFDRADPDTPFASGTHIVDGRTITFKSDGPGCSGTWTWEAGRTADELHVRWVTDGCGIVAGSLWTFSLLPPE